MPALPEAEGLALLDRFDNFSGLRGALQEIGERDSEWAGVPMPLDDIALTIEPRFPRAIALMSIGKAAVAKGIEDTAEPPPGVNLRNTFWSTRWRTNIWVWEEDGKIQWGPVGRPHGIDHMLATLNASSAWGIEQEARALQLLGGLIRHHAFKYYLLTGMFIESSPRSNIAYVFRKLRPTIALSMTGKRPRIIAALCMHPIGYYDGSWGGAMSPTDDVVAHLMLMRADEHMFWKRSNQHPPTRSEAGL